MRNFKSIISISYPWIVTVPLLLAAYTLGVYFRGTDNVLFMPAIVSLMGLSLFALMPGLKRGWRIPRSLVFVTVVLFWSYVSISVLWSTVPYNSVFFALIIGILPFLFVVFTLAPEPVKWLKIHGSVLGGAAAILSIWAGIQFFFFYEEYGPRIHHPMLNPNNLAVLFNMTLFPCLALLFYARKRPHIIAAFLLLMLVFMALLVTQSRGAILSFWIALVPFLFFCRKCEGLNWFRFITVCTGFGILFLVVDHISGGMLAGNIAKVSRGLELASAVDRLELWKSTWQMIKEHPWLGTGLGTFFYYYPAYRSRIDRSDGFFVHMDPLQFWEEMGVIAPILFYAVLIAVLYVTVKAIRVLPVDSSMRLWVMAPFCGLLALAGHTHITFHLYILIVMIPAGFLLAWWFIATEKILGEDRVTIRIKETSVKWLSAFLVIVLYLFIASWLARAAYATHLLNESNILMNHGNWTAGYEKVLIADKVAPDSYSRPYEYHAKYRLALLWDNATRRSREERKALYDQALMYVNKAIDRNPATTHLWNYKALILFSGREFDPEAQDKAIALLNETIEANPMLIDARLGLAKIYQAQGELRKALDILEGGLGRFVPKNQTTINFFLEIAKLRLQLGDKKGYEEMMHGVAAFANRYKIMQNNGK